MSLGAVFGKSRETREALLKRFQQIGDLNDRFHALTGLMSGEHADEIAGLDFSSLGLKSNSEKNLLVSSLGGLLSRTPSPERDEGARRILEQSVGLLKDREIGVEQLASILEQNRAADPLESWRLITALKAELRPEELQRLQNAMVYRMIDADLEQAMNLIVTDEAARSTSGVLKQAIDRMYDTNPSQANEWVVQNLSAIEPATGQRVIALIAETSARHGEYDTARKWADQLLDTQVRQRTLEQISSVRDSKAK